MLVGGSGIQVHTNRDPGSLNDCDRKFTKKRINWESRITEVKIENVEHFIFKETSCQ